MKEEKEKEKEEKIDEITKEIRELSDIEVGKLTDLSEWEGVKRKINKIEIIEVKSHYINGVFVPTETQNKKCLRISAEPIKQGENTFIPSELFNLKEKDGKWGISTSEKSKLRNLLQRYEVKKINELIGKEVLLKVKKNGFLGFYR